MHPAHGVWEAKMNAVEGRLKKSFSAIKQDMERIERAKRPELTVSPVDYKLRADFIAFRNSVLQEIDLLKETLLSFKQYSASDFDSNDRDDGAEEISALRDDIKDLAEIIVKKQKKYEQELHDLKVRVDSLPVKKGSAKKFK